MRRQKTILIVCLSALSAILLIAGNSEVKKGKNKKETKEKAKQEVKAEEPKFDYSALLIIDSKACACTKRRCDAAVSVIDSLDLKKSKIELVTMDYGTERDSVMKLIQQYRVPFLPALIIFDRDKNELKRWIGEVKKDELKAFLTELSKPKSEKGR